MNYFKLIWNNFKHKKLRSWLTVIGILIGIMAVVSLIALGQGLQYAISSQFSFLSPDIVTISVVSSDQFSSSSKPLEKDYVELVERVDGVKQASGRIMRPVKIKVDKSTDYTMGISVPTGKKAEFLYNAMNLKIEKGRFLDDSKDNEVLLGNMFSDPDNGLNSKVGDEILIQGKPFIVVGILKKTGSFMIDISTYINEKGMENLFDLDNEYSFIGARIDTEKDMKEIISNIEKVIRKKRHVKEYNQDFTVQSAQATLNQVNSILGGVQIFVYIIAGISILVSGIGISNTMFTSVLERTKDIGIMKSIGATNRTIFTLFLIESGLLGMIGGIIGVILGSSIAVGLAALGRQAMGLDLIQARISFALIFGAISFSFIIGTVSGLIPAIKASKQNPVEALSYTK
ncbi:ABC transporter permease [Candidatus Woesearchaeota archaeon]|nr:ABC transporter permease [Candidatus Woesearchaeota archaeon]